MKRTLVVSCCLALAGILASTIALAQSGPGSALVFNGVNQLASIPLFATNAPTNEITIEFWQNVVSNRVQGSFSAAPDNIANRINAHVPWTDGVVYWDFGNINTAGRLAYTPPSPITNRWQHFAFVASSNGNYMRIYRNGVLEAQKTGMTPYVRGNQDLRIGEVNGGFFAGQIDEFRIWNVARSSNEIATNFMRSLTGNEPGLLLYLRCNEGSGTSTADAAALGGNTTAFLSNGVTWAASGAAAGSLFVTMADSLLIDTNNNGKVNSGDTLRYTVTIQNNGTNTLTNLVLNVPANPNTTLVPGSVKFPPKAIDDLPATNSSPGNPFHVPLNTTFNLSAPGLLANDTLGAPAASVASFGGGSFGGTVTANDAGLTSVMPGVGQLTVNANGSVTFSPAAGFTGLATFQYRITNSLGASVANAAIAVGVRPSAVNESYLFAGNTMLDSSLIPQSVLANDVGDGIGISGNTAPGSGTITLLANGHFRYQPGVGFVGGLSVAYTITNGFGPSSATITLTSSARIWYIDGASVAGTADGRSDTPFKTIAQFNAVNNGAAGNPQDNDPILLRDGTYTDGIVLRVGQRLIGDGSSGFVSNALGVATPPGSAIGPGIALPGFSTLDPVITSAAGNGVTLNANNTIRGLTVGNTPAGVGYLGGSVGSLTISESSKTGTGGAISITGSGGLGVSFETLDSANAPGAAINLVGCGGTFTATAGTISAPTGPGIFVNGSGGPITYPGNITKNNAGRIVDIQNRTGGSVTLSGTLAQNNASGTGINLSSNANTTIAFNGASKVLNTAANSALTMTNNSGTTTVTFSNGGLDIDTTTGAGVVLVSANSLTINGAGNSITCGTGTPFFNNGGNGPVDINAPLTGTGRLIDIQNRTGGSVTLSGNLVNNPGTGMLIQNNSGGGTIALSGTTKTFNTGANTAVSLVNNTGTTIDFTGGGLAISRTSGIGFNATGGGTVTVTGSANTIGSGNGIGLNVVSTTIGGSGMTFQSISANGASSGIVLTTTGAGGLTVTGDGGSANNGSGGTIQNTTGAGVLLNNARNISFDQLNISSTGGAGVQGTLVANFTHVNSTFSGTGNAFNESGISFNDSDNVNTGVGDTGQGFGNNISGALTVTNNTFTNPFYSGLDVQCDNGGLSTAVIIGNTISNPGFSGVNLVGTGNASTCFNLTNAAIRNNVITSSGGNGIQVSMGNANAAGPGAVVGIPNDASRIVSITGNSISVDPTGTQGITVANAGGNAGSRTRTNFEISNNGTTNNPITGSSIGTVILIGNNGFSTMTGVVSNNVIDANHTPNGGGGNGIAGGNGVSGAGNAWTPDLTLIVVNNRITDTDGNDILLVGRSTSGTAKLKIANNNCAMPINAGGSARPGIRVDAGNSSSADDAMYLNVFGNTSFGSNGAGGIGIRKEGAVATVNDFGIYDAAGGPALPAVPTNADIETFINALNPASPNPFVIINGSNFVRDTTLAPP